MQHYTSYNYLGRFAEAKKLREETLILMRTKLGPDHRDTLALMQNLSVSASYIITDPDKGLKLGEETLALQRDKLGPDHPDTLLGMTNLALAYYLVDRRNDSLLLLRESLDVIDRIAVSIKALSRDGRSTALVRYQKFYPRFAGYLAESPSDLDEAFTVTERGKARSLLEELTARQALANSGIPAVDSQRMANLSARIEYLDGKLSGATEDTRSLRTERDATSRERDVLHHSLLTSYPRYAVLSTIKPISADQGRALLPERGVFISWLFDEEVSGVAIALPKAGDLKVLKSDLGKEMLLRAETYRWLQALPDARKFTAALREVPLAAWEEGGVFYIGAPDKKPKEAKSIDAIDYVRQRSGASALHGQWLSDTLLQPLAVQIGDAERWILAPDGMLATIPWDTLPWNGKPLGEQKQLTVIQSLSVYALLKEREVQYARERMVTKSVDRPLLAMGGAVYEAAGESVRVGFQRAPQSVGPAKSNVALDQQQQDAYRDMLSFSWPNLPGTVSEVDGLHAMVGGTKLLGRDASEATLRKLSQSGELAQYRNLHFAAHGYLNTSFPNLSALVLTKTGDDEANDGYITAGEWPAFNLKSDLMVLSACETGLGKVVSGEGVQGLPYALYVAGNRDTLLSLWKVDDLGTSIFMKRFWGKVKDGMNHATALTETKREFQRGEAGSQFTDPYYWAPFVLYGVQR